jgi:hypothetical protein
MTKMRITLKDFPDNIYILLENNFRIKFFKTAESVVGGYGKLAKTLKVSKPTLLAWKKAITGNKKIQFCSVKNIKKISKLLLERGYSEFSLENIQKNVNAYRDKAGRLWVCRPKIPIEDSVELREVIIHLMCDGSAKLTPGRTSKYSNTSDIAAKEFFDRLSIFGNILRKGVENINPCIEDRKDRIKKIFIYPVPKAISKILAEKFRINFGTFGSRIPSELFNGSRLLLVAIVRAFLIDEGSIRDTMVTFTSANLNLLKDLKKVCKKLGYKCGKISSSSRINDFSILTESISQLHRDILEIGPLPIKEKQDLLELAVELIDNPNKNFTSLDKQILDLLKEKPSTIRELAMSIRVRQFLIWKHIKKLERIGKVKNIGKLIKQGGATVWSI